jgi:hypothetical protein
LPGPDAVAGWFANGLVNYGISPAPGLFVLDIDPQHGGDATLTALLAEHGPLPTTLLVRTGSGGQHIWFRVPAGAVPPRQTQNRRTRGTPDGIDVRTHAGQVVGPGSVHPTTGAPYRVEVDAGIADSPPWLLEWLHQRSRPQKAQKAQKAPPASSPPSSPPPPPDVVASLWSSSPGASLPARRRAWLLAAAHNAAERIASAPEGTRNDTVRDEAYNLGGYLDDTGVSVDDVAAVLEPAAVAAGQPQEMVRRCLEDGRAAPREVPLDDDTPCTVSAVGRARAIADAPTDDARRAAVEAFLADPAALRGYRKPGAAGGELEALKLAIPAWARGALKRAATAVDHEARVQEGRRGGPQDAARARVLDAISYVTEEGKTVVRTTLGTARTVLCLDPDWAGRVRLNELSDLVEVGEAGSAGSAAPADDDTVLRVANAMESYYGAEWRVDTVRNALRLVATEHRYHPIRVYLNGLPEWDGVRRLPGFLVQYFAVAPSDSLAALHAAFGQNWLVSMVARVFEPGAKVDDVLTFQGPEGMRKSSGLAAIVPRPEWFMDDPIPIGDPRRLVMLLRGRWLIEFADFASVKRADIDATKGFLTQRSDRGVPMYGRTPVEVPRGCVFVATANGEQFLLVAGRRFCVVTVAGLVDVDAIVRDRDQLWAEALQLYRAGTPWHLSEELQIVQLATSEDYVVASPTVDAIRDWTEAGEPSGPHQIEDLWRQIMVPMVTGKRDGVVPFGMSEQKAFGAALKEAGWRKLPVPITRRKRWYPPEGA